jgi:hypothetical protein
MQVACLTVQVTPEAKLLGKLLLQTTPEHIVKGLDSALIAVRDIFYS